MKTETPTPHNPERLATEIVRITAGDLIYDFNLALRKIPELHGKFKMLDEPLEKNNPLYLIDQLASIPYADYGVFDYNGASYLFEGLGDPKRLWIHGCPPITELVDILNLPESARDGEYPYLNLDVSFPRISYMNRVVKDGKEVSSEEFENTQSAVERAHTLLQSFQTPTPKL